VTYPPAIYGNFAIDDLVFPDGSTQWAVPGGSAAYAALGASLWTDSPAIVAPIGEDYPANSLGSRIDLSRCRHLPLTMRNWGLYEEDGRRHFISRSSSRNWREFSPTPADVRSGYQERAHIAPLPFEVTTQLVRELRLVGTKSISLDLDDHDLLGNNSLDRMIELLSSIDFFMPSQQDVLMLLAETDPLESLRKLRTLVPEITFIAIKCGAQGSIAHLVGTEEAIRIPALSVEVLDPTGAGDAFCGGVLGGLTRQSDPREALLCGAVSASFCIEGPGFSGFATASEETVNSRLAELRQHTTIQKL